MMRSFALALVALVASASALMLPGTLPDGDRCTTTTLLGANAECQPGLSCVIWSHGVPQKKIENSGTCVKLNRNVLKSCSVSFCAKKSYAAVCVDKMVPFTPTTCGAFARRVDGGRAAACSSCGRSRCKNPTLHASDGKVYCSICELEYASCRSGFQVFGPVAPGKLVNGSVCSSSNRRVAACGAGSVCLVKDFGMPGASGASPKHSSGVCVPSTRFATCSIHFCSWKGSSAYCRTPLERVATRCGAWAGRTDFGYKPDCPRTCPRSCQSGGPVDNKGTVYCSPCALRAASCNANFAIYGSVSKPLSAEGALCSTKSPRNGPRYCKRDLKCVIEQFGYPLGGFRNTGKCTALTTWVPYCDANSCKKGNETKICRTSDTNDLTQCRFWRMRSDGGV